ERPTDTRWRVQALRRDLRARQCPSFAVGPFTLLSLPRCVGHVLQQAYPTSINERSTPPPGNSEGCVYSKVTFQVGHVYRHIPLADFHSERIPWWWTPRFADARLYMKLHHRRRVQRVLFKLAHVIERHARYRLSRCAEGLAFARIDGLGSVYDSLLHRGVERGQGHFGEESVLHCRVSSRTSEQPSQRPSEKSNQYNYSECKGNK